MQRCAGEDTKSRLRHCGVGTVSDLHLLLILIPVFFIHLTKLAHLSGIIKCLCIARWVGFELPGFAGDQFVLEKGEYPRWSTWTNCQSCYILTSFRPLKVVRETLHIDLTFLKASHWRLYVSVTDMETCLSL